MKRTGGRQTLRERHYMRIRLGAKKRESIPLPACRTEAEADARCVVIAEVAQQLLDGGRRDKVKDIAVQLGAATTARQIDLIRKSVARTLSEVFVRRDDMTFGKFAGMWTSGELHRQFPDHVKHKASAKDDAGRLSKYILPIVEDVPLRAFSLDHAELIMRGVPREASAATRRHVAQILSRLLKIAAYPARVIERSPLPTGFLPKLGAEKAKPYLYPDEDARLLACTAIDVEYRIFYGVLDREGFRTGELLGNAKMGSTPIAWSNFDLERGLVTLDVNKTDDPRTWALDAGVLATLQWWKKRSPKAPFAGIAVRHLAERFRAHLKVAGVARGDLHDRSKARRPVRVHELRATFVTLSLANGKTETWVADRTGHRSSLMINRYRRVARTAAELELGALTPLDVAIPEVGAEGGPSGQAMGKQSPSHDRQKGAAMASQALDSTEIVAPEGVGPSRPEGPRILNAPQGGDEASRSGKKRPRAIASDAHDPPLAHPFAHPLKAAAMALVAERVSWDAYDRLTLAEAEDES